MPGPENWDNAMQRRFEEPAGLVDRPANLDGFVVCPLPIPGPGSEQLSWQSAIYQIAWERALAGAQEPQPQPVRDLFTIMN
jgi:hypothetical protein